jgi:tetratricopeptide (TPR) repeat protein
MNAWLPGLIVLAVGIAVGLLAGRRMKGAKGKPTDRDLELKAADLEQRRDDLYRRLREVDAGVGPAADRPALEKAAARTLLELDRLAKKHPQAVRKQKKKRKDDQEDEAIPAVAHSPARVFLIGFGYGVGLIVLVGALIYWAVRDAQPRPEEQAAPMARPAPGQEDPHPPGMVSGDIANRIVSLDSYIVNNPEDLEARTELGYVLLGAGRYVDAFGQADQILQRDSRNVDALYMQGVVRLTMGQVDQAQVLLEAAVASNAAHVDSLTALGVIKLRGNDYDGAVALWKQALAAIGGSQPTLERMIAAAEAGSPPEEILGVPGPISPSPASAPAAPSAPTATPAAPREDGFTINIALAPGAVAPQRAILFVALSGPVSGPPAAVRRIDSPSFPLTITLTQADSMMGAELPAEGTVNVRLDADGSASTRGPEDLSASGELRLGGSIDLQLARQ